MQIPKKTQGASCRTPLYLLLALLLVACGGGSPSPSDSQVDAGGRKALRIVTTIYPVRYLCERLAPEGAQVECAAPTDVDRLFWKPTPEELRSMLEADLIVLQGAGMDQWRTTTSLPLGRLVVTCQGLEEHLLEFGKPVTHSHGGGPAHTHRGRDPHVWLDPVLYSAEARAVARGLESILPEEELPAERERLQALLDDLSGLDHAWSEIRVPEGSWLYASHPAYNYLAHRYEWPLVNLAFDPDEPPSAEALDALSASLGEKPGSVMLMESEPCQELVEALAEKGLAAVVVTPAEVLPDGAASSGEDFLTAQRGNQERLAAALAR